jgi:hypothetical protein
MIQARSRVTPYFGAPAKTQPKFQNALPAQGIQFQTQLQNDGAQLHFEGPILKTPVAFKGKASNNSKLQDSLQTAVQQASMLMTVPLLLGVSGISYLAGEDTELMVVNPTNKCLDIIG